MKVIAGIAFEMRMALVPVGLILVHITTASGQVQCLDGHGMKGKCISLKQCPNILELVQQGFLYDEDREFLQGSSCKNGVGPTPHVCCASQGETGSSKLTMSSFYSHSMTSKLVNSLTSDTKIEATKTKSSRSKFPSPSDNTINTKPIVEENSYDEDIDFASRVEVSDDDVIDFAMRIPVGPESSPTVTSMEPPSKTESTIETTTFHYNHTESGISVTSTPSELESSTLTSLETSEFVYQTIESTTQPLDPSNVTSQVSETTIEGTPVLTSTTSSQENLLAERSGEEVTTTETGDSTTSSSTEFSDNITTQPTSTASTTVSNSTYSIESSSTVLASTYQLDNITSSTTISNPTGSVSIAATKSDSVSTTPTSASFTTESTTENVSENTTTSSNSIPKYANNEFPLPPDCGNHGIKQRIFGGGITDLDEYPWVVLIEYGRSERTAVRCGGVLINYRYVLTAAHCVTPQVIKSQDGLKAVRVGEYDTRTNPDCIDGDCLPPVLIAGVEEVIVHERFHSKQRTDDIALLRLNKTVGKTRCSIPICMPSSAGFRGSRPGEEAVVAGWGKTENASFSHVKRKVSLLIYNQRDCARFYAGQGYSITLRHVCAGGKINEDSCGGDSGGPLMRLDKGVWIVEGIVSYGAKNCGTKDWPGVYTRIRSYETWIKSKMKP